MRSRLSPLIVRRVGPMAAILPMDDYHAIESQQAAAWLDDLRLFVTGWAAGLVVFATFLS